MTYCDTDFAPLVLEFAGLYLRVPLAMAPGNILKAPNMHAERAEWEKDEAARVACATDMLREYSQQLCTEVSMCPHFTFHGMMFRSSKRSHRSDHGANTH